MTASTVTRRPPSGSLAEVIDIILDKGLVIDAYVRISLVGIELITIDVRVAVASVDTYLHFAEATNRLDLRAQAEKYETSAPEMMFEAVRKVAETTVEHVIEQGADKVRSMVGLGPGSR
jgi:gas vesicle structural protein